MKVPSQQPALEVIVLLVCIALMVGLFLKVVFI